MEFLSSLRRQARGKLLVIWDGLAVHRSRVVNRWVEGAGGAVTLARLPAYAPELNPVEYVWGHLKGHLKKHALANFCPKSLTELKTTARNKLRGGQHRRSIITACWKQAELW